MAKSKKMNRMDGWKNFVTMMGTGADKRMHGHLEWEYKPPEFFEELYAGGSIPARIADLVPEEAMRHWLNFTNIDAEKKKLRMQVLKRLDARGKINQAWKWGRAFGGACLHVVTDTKDPGSPMKVGERVLALVPLSRWDMRILTTDIEYDFASPNFSRPNIYYLNVQMGSAYKGYPIHWTRMIRFDGQLVPRRTYIRNGYWHDSVLNRLYNSIRNYEQSNDNVASMLQDFNVDVFKMKNLANLIGSGKEKIVKNRIEMVEYVKSVINAMIIDSDSEEYENKSRSVEGLAELLLHQGNRMVADTDIPHTKLLGESPEGSNSTGNSTSQQWYNYVGSEQENYLRPKCEHLFELVFPEDKEITFEFKPLRVLDDTEKAEVRNKTAQSDQIYMENGVVDPSEVAKSRFGDEGYNVETTLDWDAREAGTLVPGAMGEDDGEFGAEDEGESEGSDSDPVDPSDEKSGPKGAAKDKKPAGPGGKKPKQPKDKNDAIETSGVSGAGAGVESENSALAFSPRDKEIAGGSEPKVVPFISQTMSEPFRNPATDPKLPGPGIPNQPRVIEPTIGNGITAQSGAEFGTPALPASTDDTTQKLEEGAQTHAFDAEDKTVTRAATVIVKHGDHFLMGTTNEDGRWTLPGGVVEDGESLHQGAVRELYEETGIKADKLKFLGSRLVESQQGQPVTVGIYQHTADKDEARPRASGAKDPDKEVSKWKWHDSTKKLDDEVMSNLKHPNNVALDCMGLLK